MNPRSVLKSGSASRRRCHRLSDQLLDAARLPPAVRQGLQHARLEGRKGQLAQLDGGQHCAEEDLLGSVLAGRRVHVCELDEDRQGLAHLGEEGEAGHEDIQIIVGRSVAQSEPQRAQDLHFQPQVEIP